MVPPPPVFPGPPGRPVAPPRKASIPARMADQQPTSGTPGPRPPTRVLASSGGVASSPASSPGVGNRASAAPGRLNLSAFQNLIVAAPGGPVPKQALPASAPPAAQPTDGEQAQAQASAPAPAASPLTSSGANQVSSVGCNVKNLMLY
eukprot:TRINITY_DN9828_c0_g1_i1.p1 TRINITY_DN9828_c0_g1~~TRINITY_DN9828_c0_g1_i1.p1  ORF type:complete len:148 (+),score=19.26 TRINITY_DN9828_c0_g1_i1:124-567(+)